MSSLDPTLSLVTDIEIRDLIFYQTVPGGNAWRLMLTAEMVIQPTRDHHVLGIVAASRSYTGFLLCYNQVFSNPHTVNQPTH